MHLMRQKGNFLKRHQCSLIIACVLITANKLQVFPKVDGVVIVETNSRDLHVGLKFLWMNLY